MHPVLAQLITGIELENDIPSNMASFLKNHGYTKTIEHQIRVADKIVWDQPGGAPWAHAMKAALCQDDLQKATWIYLDFLWQNQAQMPGPLHPWARQAGQQLKDLI